MGFFSNLFGSAPRKTCDTALGSFTLVYSKKNNHHWSNESRDRLLTVRGTASAPNAVLLDFLQTVDDEVARLDAGITRKFRREFTEASLDASFKHWQERFKIVAVDVMMIFDEEAYWNITFEDLESPYAHFTLFIEGESMTDFAIDT